MEPTVAKRDKRASAYDPFRTLAFPLRLRENRPVPLQDAIRRIWFDEAVTERAMAQTEFGPDLPERGAGIVVFIVAMTERPRLRSRTP